MPKSNLNIACIGGGISGLTLGRCLLARGIPAVLFDRTSSPKFHDYGITLYPSAYRSLLQILGVTEYTFKSKVAVDAANGGLGVIKNNEKWSNSEAFLAHRGKLEAWLREGLDIRWEQDLREVEQHAESEAYITTLSFANGRKVRSRVVIGADGPHSMLRQAVIQQHQLTALPFVAFNWKKTISRAEFDTMYIPYMKGTNIVNLKHGDIRLNVSVVELKGDEVRLSWTWSRPTRGLSDPLYKPTRSLSAATEIPEEFFEEISVLEPSRFPQPFSDVLNPQRLRQDRILHWVMRTTLVPQDALETAAKKGVMLMGDAAHAEPIIGGWGANAAIEDAVSLAKWITNNKMLEEWYSTRYSAWAEATKAAELRINEVHKLVET